MNRTTARTWPLPASAVRADRRPCTPCIGKSSRQIVWVHGRISSRQTHESEKCNKASKSITFSTMPPRKYIMCATVSISIKPSGKFRLFDNGGRSRPRRIKFARHGSCTTGTVVAAQVHGCLGIPFSSDTGQWSSCLSVHCPLCSEGNGFLHNQTFESGGIQGVVRFKAKLKPAGADWEHGVGVRVLAAQRGRGVSQVD
jgi:hypothetical protein